MDIGSSGAFAWGLLAGSSLVVGALVAFALKLSQRVIGLTLAFGSGVLISAVAFDLVEEGYEVSDGSGGVALGLFAGCAVFFVADQLIERLGSRRGAADTDDDEGGPLSIVLGATLDGIPESAVIGLTLSLSGSVGGAYLAAVYLSNLPEAIAATRGLLDQGWGRRNITLLWTAVMLVCALSSLAGFVLLDGAGNGTIAFVLAFAGGAILTMLGSEMVPQAHEHGGRFVGVITTLGFGVAFALHVLS